MGSYIVWDDIMASSVKQKLTCQAYRICSISFSIRNYDLTLQEAVSLRAGTSKEFLPGDGCSVVTAAAYLWRYGSIVGSSRWVTFCLKNLKI